MPQKPSERSGEEVHFCPYHDSNPLHPAGGIDAILTLLPRFPNFHPRTGHEGSALAALPPGKTYVPIVQEEGWATGRVSPGAENLAPTLGFKTQTVQLIARRYTHVMKAYRGSKGTVPH